MAINPAITSGDKLRSVVAKTSLFLARRITRDSLVHKPAINYLLTFATLPHIRLLNIILNHFYLASPMDFRFYHTVFQVLLSVSYTVRPSVFNC